MLLDKNLTAKRFRFEKRIYIALPDVTARRVMFKLNLGDTRNTLHDHDFAELAEMTDGYHRTPLLQQSSNPNTL